MIKNSMLKSIRAKAGIGSSELRFTTNRVESINAKLKLESKGKKMDVCNFADLVQKTVERQQRNINWAIIGERTFKNSICIHSYSIVMADKRSFYIYKNI